MVEFVLECRADLLDFDALGGSDQAIMGALWDGYVFFPT